MPPHTPPASRTVAFLALAAAGGVWGTGFLFGKIAFAQLGVGHMLLYRFAFAAIGFLIVAIRRPLRVRRQDWGAMIVAGTLGVPVQFLVQFEGLTKTSVSHASLMVGTTPILLAVSALIVFREKLHWGGWLGIIGSTIGVGLVLYASSQTSGHANAISSASLLGDVLVLVALVAGVVWMLISKKLMQYYPPLELSAYIILIGTVLLAIFVFATDGAPPVALHTGIWLALAASGVLTTTCTTLLWNWGFSHVPAGEAGVFLNFEPVIGTLLGVWLLHEQLGVAAVAGGVLIVAAAVIVTLQGDETPKTAG